MRQIKFCGKTFEWKFVYGDLIHDEKGRTYIGNFDGGEFNLEQVEPESVRQFLGYDGEGRELYEGDILEYNIFA